MAVYQITREGREARIVETPGGALLEAFVDGKQVFAKRLDPVALRYLSGRALRLAEQAEAVAAAEAARARPAGKAAE